MDISVYVYGKTLTIFKMQRWINSCSVFMLLVILPLQGIAIVTMPVCAMPANGMQDKMFMKTSAMPIDAMPAIACQKQSGDCCVSTDDQNRNGSSDKCFTCHLSFTQIPMGLLLITIPEVATQFSPVIQVPYHTSTAGLYRPPKQLAS